MNADHAFPTEKILSKIGGIANSSRRLILKSSRQKVSPALLSQADACSSGWGSVRNGKITGNSRLFLSKLLIDTLKTAQSMSPADVCVISSIFRESELHRAENGIDTELVKTFSDFLNRTLSIFTESLSLTELFQLYVQLLHLSSTEPEVVPERDHVSRSLTSRIRNGEELPIDFPTLEFVDTYIEDMDECILNTLSRWALRSVYRYRRESNPTDSSELTANLLAIQKGYDYKKISPPSKEFIDAIRIFITV